MPDERFEEHLRHPRGRGRRPPGAHDGAAGGAACGDVVRMSIALSPDGVVQAGFDAQGCGATIAAASAAVELVAGARLLDAARIGTADVAAALGGLSAGKLHAAELAADALHRALGAAARADGALRPPPGGRTLVAMSGGVDSAVAALLCATEGGDVAAVTLELWRDPFNDPERSCCSASAVRGARALAHRLRLPHFTLDLRDEFRAGVVEPFLADHAAGLTPNPCVRCNGSVRLDAMVEFAVRIGARALATGHYARKTADGLLRAAAVPAKDQSYMLGAVDPQTLSALRFPLGDLEKTQVRRIAADHALPVAAKPDSQDLCFLAGTGRTAFLARHGGLGERPGDIVDRGGRVVGRHRGHHGFTVGQRRGLGVGGSGAPLYVLATDAAANTVTVGSREELNAVRVGLRDVVLHRPAAAVTAVKLRYRSRAVPCRIDGGAGAGRHDALELELGEPFAAVAPGQTACLLAGDVVLGHGTIAPTLRS